MVAPAIPCHCLWICLSKAILMEILAFRASHGTWENGKPLLQGGRGLPCIKGMSTGGDGEVE